MNNSTDAEKKHSIKSTLINDNKQQAREKKQLKKSSGKILVKEIIG